MNEFLTTQALFLHERLVQGALEDSARLRLLTHAARGRAIAPEGDRHSHIAAYQDAVAHVLTVANELDVDVVQGKLSLGLLVTLTQDFNVRRLDDARGAFRTTLDIDRSVELTGVFSTEWLVGSTGNSETFGRHRFTMLAYIQDFDSPPGGSITLRPLFIGWRLRGTHAFAAVDDRHQLSPFQCDQFKLASTRRPSARQLTAIAALPEKAVKQAFAEIIGEPYVGKDWGGERSDLFTSRLLVDGSAVNAAFAFKGPSVKGPLHIADMGKRGDQGIRLFEEPVDVVIVQHHQAVSAAVRHLMAALARTNGKRFMIIDGATTAAIFAAYGYLPSGSGEATP